jgi:hypothetical protein
MSAHRAVESRRQASEANTKRDAEKEQDAEKDADSQAEAAWEGGALACALAEISGGMKLDDKQAAAAMEEKDTGAVSMADEADWKQSFASFDPDGELKISRFPDFQIFRFPEHRCSSSRRLIRSLHVR